jgi:hypothetical protein
MPSARVVEAGEFRTADDTVLNALTDVEASPVGPADTAECEVSTCRSTMKASFMVDDAVFPTDIDTELA